MARKAAEEAWGRQFAYLVAADPEKKAHCQAFFDNALQTAGAKHLTLNTADPGGVDAVHVLLLLLLLYPAAVQAALRVVPAAHHIQIYNLSFEMLQVCSLNALSSEPRHRRQRAQEASKSRAWM